MLWVRVNVCASVCEVGVMWNPRFGPDGGMVVANVIWCGGESSAREARAKILVYI